MGHDGIAVVVGDGLFVVVVVARGDATVFVLFLCHEVVPCQEASTLWNCFVIKSCKRVLMLNLNSIYLISFIWLVLCTCFK